MAEKAMGFLFFSCFQGIHTCIWRVKGWNLSPSCILMLTGWKIYIYVSPFQCQESSTQERSSSPPIPTVLKRMEVCTIGGLRARTIPWFFGHFWKCSEVVEFWHVDTFKNGRKIKGSFLLWALQLSWQRLCFNVINVNF